MKPCVTRELHVHSSMLTVLCRSCYVCTTMVNTSDRKSTQPR
uniref:Uncharacterized protein n=1 Tax=Setaria italica TaxID=4555 RepID=K4A429_SETIT